MRLIVKVLLIALFAVVFILFIPTASARDGSGGGNPPPANSKVYLTFANDGSEFLGGWCYNATTAAQAKTFRTNREVARGHNKASLKVTARVANRATECGNEVP